MLQPVLTSLKVLVGAFVTPPLVLLAVLSLVLDHAPDPAWSALLGLAAVAVVTTLVGWLLGRRTKPLHVETPPHEAQQRAMAALRTSTVGAAVITEVPAVLATTTGFLVRHGQLVTILPIMLVTPALVLLTAWPSRARLDALAATLRSAGYAGPLPLDEQQVTYR